VVGNFIYCVRGRRRSFPLLAKIMGGPPVTCAISPRREKDSPGDLSLILRRIWTSPFISYLVVLYDDPEGEAAGNVFVLVGCFL